MKTHFEWDRKKNKTNTKKHGVSEAQQAFLDKSRIILEDEEHSVEEKRFYCLGKIHENVLTVRFTFRHNSIRIFGAGYWRKGQKRYEQENNL